MSAGQVPEMILLNEENSHYDLIVPADHRLALEGGLDYQRAKHGITRNEAGKEKPLSAETPVEVLEEKIQVLEDKLDLLQARCSILEEENKKLKESCTNETINEVYDSYDENITSPLEAERKEVNQREFPCTICSLTFGSGELLSTHVKKHMDQKYECDKCKKNFHK